MALVPFRITIFRTVTACAALALLTAGAVDAHAETVRYEDGYAIGIQNMRVGGQCYDVQFEDGSYRSVFGRDIPMFENDPLGASASADAIRDALNDHGVLPEINESENEVLWVPHHTGSQEFQAAQVGHNLSSDPWRRFADFVGEKTTDWQSWDFATFEQGPDVIYAANTGWATGIHNLLLDGVCVDVRFADGSYNEVYSDHPPRYLGLELRADYAANMIQSVLNAESSVPEINASNNEVLWLPTDRTRTTFEAEQTGHNSSAAPWQRYADFSGTRATNFAAWDFAVFDQSLDCNRDGVVDINDMNCSCGTGFGDDILRAINSMPGDLDGNGAVTFSDFLTLSGNMGESGPYTDGDLDCDGTVGFGDFLILSKHYGQGRMVIREVTPVNPIPEPGCLALAAGAIPLAMLGRRRRERSA